MICRRRVSKKPPTVKTKVQPFGIYSSHTGTGMDMENMGKLKKPLRRNGFDFLHKPGPTVHQYADGPGLLVLTAPLTSASLSKKSFLTD